MEENRRLAYLASLGISSWSPRFILPNAKLSEKVDFYEEALGNTFENVVADAVVESDRPEAQLDKKNEEDKAPIEVKFQGSAAVIESAQDAVAEESKITKEAKTVLQVEQKEAVNRETPRKIYPDQFALSAIAVTGHGFIVADAEVSSSTLLLKQHLNLLSGILHVINGNAKSLSKPSEFRWPFPGLDINPSSDMAFEAVSAFLEKNIEGQKIRWILALGDMSGSVLECLSPAFTNEVLEIKGPSIQEMLFTPGAKKLMWQNLSNLMPRLSELKA